MTQGAQPMGALLALEHNKVESCTCDAYIGLLLLLILLKWAELQPAFALHWVINWTANTNVPINWNNVSVGMHNPD
jgi:hypothetical protein